MSPTSEQHERPRTRRRAGSSSRTVLAVFAGLIALGTFLLMLPIATVSGKPANPLDALFTATSSVCVTGLVVQNTASYWSPFGKSVILILIQLGGLGVLTSVMFLSFLANRGSSIGRRNLYKEATSAPHIGGIYSLARFIIGVTIACEALGALALMPSFVRDFGVYRGVGAAIFHSISAFCNAGIDVLPRQLEFASLAAYRSDAPVLIITSLLIIVGGIGFLTWDDLRTYGLRVRKYRLQTKVVLAFVVLLLATSYTYLFLVEFSGMPFGERVLSSWFCSVTPRTAGFSTIDYGLMSESGRLLTIMLMLVGGSSGSTAGGMKVTTIAVIVIATANVLRRRKETVAFDRRIEPDVVRSAFAIFVIYIGVLFVGTVFMSTYDGVPLVNAMFESASALATVGLSTGITPSLSVPVKLMLISFMYFGRVGGLTLAYAMSSSMASNIGKHPSERMAVG